MSENNNGSKVWEFTKWTIALLIVGSISLANVVHTNSLNIKNNDKSISNNFLIVTFIQKDLLEIKQLLKRNNNNGK